jgi:hypothetical protein
MKAEFWVKLSESQYYKPGTAVTQNRGGNLLAKNEERTGIPAQKLLGELDIICKIL